MGVLLQQVFSWLNVLVAASGAIVCGMKVGRSRWAGLLTGAFVAEATILAFYPLAALLVRSGGLKVSSLGAAYLLVSIASVAARIAVVAGVGGVLSELVQSRAR